MACERPQSRPRSNDFDHDTTAFGRARPDLRETNSALAVSSNGRVYFAGVRGQCPYLYMRYLWPKSSRAADSSATSARRGPQESAASGGLFLSRTATPRLE